MIGPEISGFPGKLPRVVAPGIPWDESEIEEQVNRHAGQLLALFPKGPRAYGIHCVLCRDPLEALFAFSIFSRAGFPICVLPWRHPKNALSAMMARLGPGILWLGKQEYLENHPWERPVRPIPKLFGEKGREPCRPLDNPPSYLVPDGWELFLFTSGSTGVPRIAVHSHRTLHANAMASLERMPLAPEDQWHLNLPLFHVGGLGIVYRCAAAGAGVAIPHPSVGHSNITHLSVVAAQLSRMSEGMGDLEKLKSMKAILLGGGQFQRNYVKT